MSSDQALRKSYENALIGVGYDALSWLIYAPLGGREALRQGVVELLRLEPGQRVLELGCGTGGLTRLLTASGAQVTSVDWSRPMLGRARRRAPEARFVHREITGYVPDQAFDLVLLAFVLHELTAEERARALLVARRALADTGRVAVVDHAEPGAGVIAKSVSRFIHSFEPPSISGWVGGGFEPELERAGLRAYCSQTFAQGTARAVLARAEG